MCVRACMCVCVYVCMCVCLCVLKYLHFIPDHVFPRAAAYSPSSPKTKQSQLTPNACFLSQDCIIPDHVFPRAAAYSPSSPKTKHSQLTPPNACPLFPITRLHLRSCSFVLPQQRRQHMHFALSSKTLFRCGGGSVCGGGCGPKEGCVGTCTAAAGRLGAIACSPACTNRDSATYVCVCACASMHV